MADCKRYWICQGDTTTAGGQVQASGYLMPVDGKSVALEGDPVHCPACHSTGTIQCVAPLRPCTDPTGRQISSDGDVCLCKCPVPPRLKASQRRHGMGFGAEEIASVSGGAV